MSDPRLKILVVVESINSDDSSGAKANFAFIKNLQKAGFDLLVYHYSRKEILIDGIKCVAIKEYRKSPLFFLSRAERYVRYLTGIGLNPKIEKKTGFSFTLKNDRNSIVSALKKERSFNPDWVFTLSQGGSFRPHHALLKIRELHHKWIAYIHDPYPMHWYPKPYTWKEPGFKAKEKFMIDVADHCKYAAFPSLYLKEWMGSHYRQYFDKGIIIPHQLSGEIKKTKPSFIELNNSEFIILHAGNFLQARQPYGLIEGFKKFVKKYPEVKARLIHVGPAPHYMDYLKEESELNSSIEVYCENKSFSEVAWLQDNASVNVVIEAKANFSPFLPGKFPHIIAAKKPLLVLGPPKSEVKRILGDEFPYWAEIDDKARISSLIEKLYQTWLDGPIQLDYNKIHKYLSNENLKEVILSLN